MVVRRRKKVQKYRGSITHGGGSRKKRRGAGSRGGRGRAGSGKRAGHKRLPLGSMGFLPRRESLIGKERVIAVSYFTGPHLQVWQQEGKIQLQNGVYQINLTQLGYHKLLGTGTLGSKVQITVAAWSAQAEEKVKAAGGQLVQG